MPPSPQKHERIESRFGRALFGSFVRIRRKANELFEHKELANKRRPLNKTPSETKKDFDDDWEDEADSEQSTEPDMWRMRELTTKPGSAACKSDELRL